MQYGQWKEEENIQIHFGKGASSDGWWDAER